MIETDRLGQESVLPDRTEGLQFVRNGGFCIQVSRSAAIEFDCAVQRSVSPGVTVFVDGDDRTDSDTRDIERDRNSEQD